MYGSAFIQLGILVVNLFTIFLQIDHMSMIKVNDNIFKFMRNELLVMGSFETAEVSSL